MGRGHLFLFYCTDTVNLISFAFPCPLGNSESTVCIQEFKEGFLVPDWLGYIHKVLTM